MAAKRTRTRYEGVYTRITDKGVKVLDITYQRDGKKVWEKVGPEPKYSPKVARDLRAKRLTQIWHGEEMPQDRADVPNFGEIGKKFLAWAKIHKKSWKADDIRYKLHLKPRFGSVKVDRIAPLDLEKLKKDLMDAGKTPATVRHVLRLFSTIFNKAREWGLTRAANPLQGKVKMPVVDNARERLLTPAEVEQLLLELQRSAPQAYALSLLGYHTGARRGELTALKWGDVDLEGRTVVFRHTKNGSTRRVPLNAKAWALLGSMTSGAPGDLVLATRSGKMITRLSTAFQRAADKLFNQGVTDPRHKVVFHSLRHAFTSRLVSEGVPLRVVMELTGHRSLAMLQRYAHLAPDAGRSAVELLANSPVAAD